MDERLIKRLIATIKCGTCGKNYCEDHVEIVEHDENVWFLNVFCSSCRIKSLVAAVIQREKEVEAINDLTGAEIARFKYLDGVDGDDMLDMRQFLKDFNGDFASLFQENKS
jgi:DNA-directed RNA polymerase subunit RPC12/RpoP